MECVPVLREGRRVGEMSCESQSLYMYLRVRAEPCPGLWCAWAVGESGEVRVGVLEPEGERAVIRRRLSRRVLAPAGRLARCELRNVEEEGWEATDCPERFGPQPCRALRGLRGARTRTDGGRRYLALPCQEGEAFPLPALFCFARAERIDGHTYWVFAFDAGERPIF